MSSLQIDADLSIFHPSYMNVRLLTRAQVVELLPMKQAIELMRRGFAGLASQEIIMPPRTRMETGAGDILLKPTCVPGEGISVKLVLTYPENAAIGLPVVQGLMTIFDDNTGTPLSVMDAASLTAIRTGAGGGLAIDLLARPDCQTVALIGAGVQARTQLYAAMEVREIQEVFLYDPVEATREKLLNELATHQAPPKVTVVDHPDEGVSQADIVITATTSATPTFSGSALREGAHVNAIGAYQPDRREVDETAMRRAYVVVDGHDAAGIEAGELRIPGIKADADLSEVLTEKRPARTDNRQITLFKSVGMAVQDAMSAGYVFDQAERKGIGMVIDFAGDEAKSLVH